MFAAGLLLALSLIVYGLLSLHGFVQLRRRHRRDRHRRIAELVAFSSSLVVRNLDSAA